jgi:hypothetical protein
MRGEDGRVLQNPPTIPPSAVNALAYASPTEVDLARAAVPTPPRNSPERQALLTRFNVANAEAEAEAKAKGSGRRRKSRKSKRKTRKSRRRYTRRR